MDATAPGRCDGADARDWHPAAVPVSRDTGFDGRFCKTGLEVCNSVARVQSFEPPWPYPSFTARRLVVGGLEGVVIHAHVFTWGRVRGSRRCRRGVQMIAEVEPALLGSVSTHKGDRDAHSCSLFSWVPSCVVLMVVVEWHFHIRFCHGHWVVRLWLTNQLYR